MVQIGDLIQIESARKEKLLLNPVALHVATLHAERYIWKETGGVLLGQFALKDGTPIVQKCVPAMSDSQRGSTRFMRGIRGLRELLIEEFEKGYQYIGEWHTHPEGPIMPSCVDHLTMMGISRSRIYAMPRPLLMILAGSSKSGWRASVHRYGLSVRPERYEILDVSDLLTSVEL